MAFNVNQFREHFGKHGDYAKPSKFDVRIYTPPALVGEKLTDLRFQCETAELPGYNINTVDNKIYGVSTPVASFPSFSDLSLTFICAGDFWEKKLFDKWLNLVIPINRYNPNYKYSYTTDIEINQYTDYADSQIPKPIYTAKIFKAFPISISPLQMNWGDDGIHRLTVVFKYDYWTTGAIEAFNNSPTTKREIDSILRPPSGSTLF
jgi:hypothetical protein